jgi:hypothetical protein
MNLVPDVINIAKKSQYLSGFDIHKGGLFGGGIDKNLPQLIYTVRKSVERTQELNGAFPDTRATATVTINGIGVLNDTFEVTINDVVTGFFISLGTYTRQSGDTTTTILATNIAAALTNNNDKYLISANGNVITITAPVGYGAAINGGNNVAVVAPSLPAVSAVATFGANLLTSLTIGEEVTFAIEFPALNFTFIGNYTIASGDNVASVLAQNIADALEFNSSGYDIQAVGDNVVVTAFPDEGSDINGLRFRATWNMGSNSTSVFFFGGQNEAGIAFSLQQFSGGVTATSGQQGLIPLSNYLYWLCGKYALISKGINGSGSIASVTPESATIPNRYDFIVSGTSFIISGQSLKMIPEFIGYNIIFVRNGATQSTQDVGGTYYTWNSVTGAFQLFNGEAQDGETFTIIPTLA